MCVCVCVWVGADVVRCLTTANANPREGSTATAKVFQPNRELLASIKNAALPSISKRSHRHYGWDHEGAFKGQLAIRHQSFIGTSEYNHSAARVKSRWEGQLQQTAGVVTIDAAGNVLVNFQRRSQGLSVEQSLLPSCPAVTPLQDMQHLGLSVQLGLPLTPLCSAVPARPLQQVGLQLGLPVKLGQRPCLVAVPPQDMQLQ